MAVSPQPAPANHQGENENHLMSANSHTDSLCNNHELLNYTLPKHINNSFSIFILAAGPGHRLREGPLTYIESQSDRYKWKWLEMRGR